jgi:hypothetical protein
VRTPVQDVVTQVVGWLSSVLVMDMFVVAVLGYQAVAINCSVLV